MAMNERHGGLRSFFSITTVAAICVTALGLAGCVAPPEGGTGATGKLAHENPLAADGFITVYRGINLPPGTPFSGVYASADGLGQMVVTSPEAAFQYGVLTGKGAVEMSAENTVMVVSFQINPGDTSVVAQDLYGTGEHFFLQPSVDVTALPNFQSVQTTLGDIAADGTVKQTILGQLTDLADDPAGKALLDTSPEGADLAASLAQGVIKNPEALALTVDESGTFALDGTASLLADSTGAGFEVTGKLVGDAIGTALSVAVGVISFATDTETSTLRDAKGEQIVPLSDGALSGVPAVPASIQDSSQWVLNNVLPNGDWSATNQTTGIATGFLTVGGKTYVYNEAPILDADGNPTGIHVAKLSNGDTLEVDDHGLIVEQGDAVFRVDVTASGGDALVPPTLEPDPSVALPITEVTLPELTGGDQTGCDNAESAAPGT